jgi:hypothetical protein
MFQNCDKYQEFRVLLDQLHSDLTQVEIDINKLKLGLLHLQQFFREQIVSLPDIDSREQSYQTEISKQLRLLTVDLMFLQGARQPITVKEKLQSMTDRLELTKQYCHNLADKPRKA